ncbi:MAG: hypothetical protein IJ780_05155, partial [Neisseriaceae bacterium]|nr:hypothetical protein [Neisseriaceae bacterium]
MDNTQEKQEFDATAEQYGGEKAYNQAKESGKTALTYKQWVQVRTPSFKAWFGDWENDITTASVVRNPTTSEPLVVYHGTRPNLAGFTVFDTDDEKGNGSIFGKNHGSFFTDKIEVARSY